MSDVVDVFARENGFELDVPHDATLADRWDRLIELGLERPGAAFADWVDLALIGGVVPVLLANSADLRSLLETLVRFHPLWGDDTITAIADGTSLTIALDASGDGADGVHPATFDAFVGVLDRVVGRLTALGPGAVRSRHSGDHAASLRFVAEELSTPVLLANPDVAAMVQGIAEIELHDRTQDVASLVRAHIDAELPDATLRSVAARMAMSTRTLQVRLRESGTTYAELHDERRRHRAVALLSEPSTSVTAAATAAGFESIEGFSRAFRRWTGFSPSTWRDLGRAGS